MSAPATRPLTEEQIEEYYREGYLVVERLVPEEIVDCVVIEARKIPVTPGGSWTPSIFIHDEPLQNPRLHQLLVEPHVVGAIEQILEAPARVWYGMLAIVPAHGGTGLQWHQDNMYTPLLGRALNVFIALCDITPEKANLWMAPKSHTKGIQESLTTEGHRVAATPENGVPLPTLAKGSVCIFDRSTLHHSKRNETAEDRYAYAAQYQEDKARLASTGRRDPRRMRASDLSAMFASTL